MSDLSNYRASIARLLDADDVEAAFEKEGFSGRTAVVVSGSKSFVASRSIPSDNPSGVDAPCGRMSHRQTNRRMK